MGMLQNPGDTSLPRAKRLNVVWQAAPPTSPVWQRQSHHWSCSSRSHGRTARNSSSSAGPPRAASIAEGRRHRAHPSCNTWSEARVLWTLCGSLWLSHLGSHAMWNASQHQGAELLRAGQGDCNLVPGEVPHVMVVGELQVGLPPQPLWGVFHQRSPNQGAGSRLSTFRRERAEEGEACSSLHTLIAAHPPDGARSCLQAKVAP